MPSQVEPGYLRLTSELESRVFPYVSDNHLDYYCGKYSWAHSIANDKPDCQVLGFDPRLDTTVHITLLRQKVKTIAHALKAKGLIRNPHKNNYVYTNDPSVVAQQAPFASASGFFKFNSQEGGLFEGVLPHLSSDATLVVVDYDMVEMPQEEFFMRFRAQAELAEIRTLGLDEAYRTYTHVGLEDCVRIGEAFGFQTLEQDRFLGQYFIWIGAKVQNR